MAPPLPAPLAAIGGLPSSAPLGAAGNGWFYEVLTKAGLSPSTAHTVDSLVLRPLEIVLVALVAVLVAHFGAKAVRAFLGRLAGPALHRSESRRADARLATMLALAANVWRFGVFLMAVFLILGLMGLDLAPLLASATVIGATIGFGAQSLVRDYLSGFLLAIEDQFAIGDTIAVNTVSGTVEDLTLRVTRLRAADGKIWYVPNGEIRVMANTSRGSARATVVLTVAPAQKDDLERARQVVTDAAGSVAARPEFAPHCPEPPQLIAVADADAASFRMQLTLKTRPPDRDHLEAELRRAAVQALADAGLWPAGPPDPGEPPARPG
ncbi:MAG TPA: mechanosensitive ion channel family protein [Acidimicrobiales bacterium]|nr:mechanosensitive ion channel family protein [Acidimicrobiales bacterium]